MLRASLCTFLLLGVPGALHPAASLSPQSSVREITLQKSEAFVAESIVRILRDTTYGSGPGIRHMINHGTGVIIGEQHIHNNTEYLVLSNEHVANNEHVRGKSTLSIVEGEGVSAPIRLEALAIDYKRDQALLRTVRCPDRFTVLRYVIGVPPGNITQDTAFTEGYGNGKFSVHVGDILSTHARAWGIRCYRFDIAVGGGQSGAPLVVIGADRRLYLPGLVFCGNDLHTEVTPLYPGKGVLQQFASIIRSGQ